MIEWEYAENDTQKYYDATINGVYLLVFANKWQPDIWMGMVGNTMIRDKTRNDRQRAKQGLAKGCETHLLQRDAMLCNSDPKYMMKKVERCFRQNKTEICR